MLLGDMGQLAEGCGAARPRPESKPATWLQRVRRHTVMPSSNVVEVKAKQNKNEYSIR